MTACFVQAVPSVPPAAAQDLGRIVSPILVIDSERLFTDSAFGRRVSATLEAERTRLEAEELALTEKRPSLTAEEFRALADAFDAKVQNLREEREAAQQQFVQKLEAERQAFFQEVVPILFTLGQELGAVAILDHRVVVLPLADIDVTALAIERVDGVLGGGEHGATDGN